ncbi:apoptosis regulator BAX [Elysia marginata]|uniref:Apoptosis regulator BAX n=1 Tax=Elysia marginata TaxID=1093978 RepID=A0AAV4HAW6_9GAST|nr:apoptosis regulator BAX [Elysia marginata]
MDNNSCAKGSRLFVRRQSGTRLEPLHIPPLDTSEPVRYVNQSLCYENWHHIQKNFKDVEEEGQELFQNFLKDQIEREPAIIVEDLVFERLSGYSNDLWAEDGLALQLKADAFKTTRQREDIRASSAAVDLSMTHEQFKAHLNRFYFKDRAKLRGILGLFYLCSDITIRALKESLELFEKYLMWSLQFIKTSVSLWVHQQGGWSLVLKTPVHPIIKVCLWIAMSAVALFTLVRLNKWKSSTV